MPAQLQSTLSKTLIILISIVVAALITAFTMFRAGVHSFLFAWTVNFMLMLCVSVVMQTLKPELSFSYFTTRNFEKKGVIYEWFGVHAFRKMMVLTGWEKLHKKGNPVKPDLQAIEQLEYNTRQAEFNHLSIFIIVQIIWIYACVVHSFKGAIWLLVLNVLLNLYPILVQRYNRPRLQRIIRLYKKHATDKIASGHVPVN
ncbi:hypothetical protein DYU05_05505 [Mucilaginibacter terrenus]|uniref:Glycosyl-4,4'-diaponeurosporenoate acyltransferase n=1 Tax=Mucilaginibacter terrenus TaxID=2482727 RepID=A0A3E2NVN7_9SPHI|nr:hypothetical protein [Mucilaginibacter terrenus]RFZ85062.1 hypothetical protein DYU05_05505 [Mucilaginibacter terrenus]